METNQQPPPNNPFMESGFFVSTAQIWTPYKMSFEGFGGAGKTLTMCCVALGIWEAEGKKGNVVLVDTERSAKFIAPFFHQFGLIEGKNFFVTHTRSLQRWGEILKMAESVRGTIFLTDTITHIYEEMLIQFERDQGRRVKYPQDAMIIKPMWKEKFSNPFCQAVNTHLMFTGRAAFEYTMQLDEDTQKKTFEATGVKFRGDNELAYETDVVVLMERLQKMTPDGVETARSATILKDRSRLIDGKQFVFRPFEPGKDKQGQMKVWEVFEPVYRLLASGNKNAVLETQADRAMGPLFQKGGGEAFYQQRLRAERTVEEIVGVYSQWGLGGTSGVEKSVRAILNLLVFNSRSTAGLVELHPDVLAAGVETIDHLSRYVAKHMEFVEKSFKASQADKISEFLAEEKKKYQAEREKQIEQDDDIPEFASTAGPRSTPGDQASPAGGVAPKPEGPAPDPAPKPTLSDEEKAAIDVAVTRDIESAIMDAKTAMDTDTVFADYGTIIAALSEENRKRIHRAYNAKKKQLKRGGEGSEPELRT